MGLRKPHSKTRLGCSQCKQRRVKCDQTHPHCRNCSKRGFQCSFLALAPSSQLSSLAPNPAPNQVVAAPGVSFEVHKFRLTPSKPSFPSETSQTVDQRIIEDRKKEPLDHLHKDLLCHYETNTSLTLAFDEPSRKVWQVELPKLAVQHPYLMSGLQSITCLHLSESDKENKRGWTNRAITHMNRALSSYRDELQNITQENIELLFGFSSFVVVFMFKIANDDIEETLASIPHSKTGTCDIDNIVRSIIKGIRCVRGSVVILKQGWEWLNESIMSPLITKDWWPKNPVPATELAREEDRRLARLERLWAGLGRDHEEYSGVLSHALARLREAFVLASHLLNSPMNKDEDVVAGRLTDWGAIYFWPVRVQPDFVKFMEERQTEALVLLAHYAILPGRIEEIWWVGNFGRNIIFAAALALGKDKWHLIDWPVQALRFDLSAVPVVNL
ncbi:hypothetical protein GQ43DRAFT_473820 [Delitschia confertaspora ATCC 74209]|uniref:Zn(2)-C6 fungal-type domain-containing protein n=1 Tax=Delitschia confertaspora ATCC 74209 TaxID=1513339 RepID=A0A9P4MTN1_9PLEO|nr:hypothetical protein GQ43DRAFT_473820 [Delitschia confertaspora ATCC 74209]